MFTYDDDDKGAQLICLFEIRVSVHSDGRNTVPVSFLKS